MKHNSSVVFSLFAKISFKIIVVGDKNTGKTNLILRYVKDVYSKSHNNPQGVEFYSSTIDFGGDEIALQLWDTAGSSEFKSITKSFYQQASCVLIVYSDPLKVKSTIDEYLLEINEFAHQLVQIVIVRAKIDQTPVTNQQRIILDEFVKKDDSIILWMGVSAKTGENVKEFFKTLGSALFSKYHEEEGYQELVDPKKDSFMLSPRKAAVMDKKKKCCS